MNESTNLTPAEQVHAGLYRDPALLFKRALGRKLSFIIPSLALMIVWFFTRELPYAILGYGILLYEEILGILLARRGIQTTNQVLTKFQKNVPSEANAPHTGNPADPAPAGR
jgi:hypothetical protein